VLKEDEGGFDEDELARLSEEAGKEHPAELTRVLLQFLG